MDGEKKEKLRGFRGSLASRIILIAMVLLVLPLLALVGLLYLEEAHLNEKNNYFTLKVLMDEKIGQVEEILTHEMETLFDIATLVPQVEDREKVLKKMAEKAKVSSLFHLKKGEDGRYFCDLSSNDACIGKDFTHVVKEAKKGTIFIVDPKTEVFYLTYPDPEQEGAWVIAFHETHITENFPISEEILYPASTAILDRSGTVLIATDKKLDGYQFKEPAQKSYNFQGKAYISISKDVPKTNFSLLISAPEEVNFVDLPHLVMRVAIAVTLILVIGGGGALLLTKKLSKPLRKLALAMDQVGKGDLKKRFSPEPMGFEINAIGEVFNETVDSLNENIEVAHRERLERETYEKELLIGEAVQRSILPKELPEFPGVSMAARFIAAKEVGGDFYDLLPNKALMLSIADTAGKGISACLYSLSIRSMLRSFGEMHEELATTLKETNNLFCKDTGDTGVFVTAFVGVFDPKTKVLTYANCGHFPALLQKKEGTIEKLTTQGMALGVIPFETVETKEKQLESGDLLLLFTDGVVEAHNGAMEMFGEERLIASLKKKRGDDPQTIVDEIIEEVALFAEGCPQHDDLSLLVIKID